MIRKWSSVELLAGVALALQRAEAHAAARAEGGARARAPAADDDDFVDVSPAEPKSAGDTSSHSGKKRGLFKGHPPSANAKRVCIAPAVAPSPFFDAPPAPPKSSTIGGSLAIEQQAVAALLHAAIANAEDEEMYNELLSHAEKLNNHIMDASALRIALTKARRAARESIGITGSDVKAARQVSHVTPFDRMFSGPKPASRAAHLEYMQVTDTMFLELVRTAEETPAGKHRDTSNIGRPHLLSTRQMIALALHYSTTTASRSDTSVAFDIPTGSFAKTLIKAQCLLLDALQAHPKARIEWPSLAVQAMYAHIFRVHNADLFVDPSVAANVIGFTDGFPIPTESRTNIITVAFLQNTSC